MTAITGMNYILKGIQTENNILHNFQILLFLL